MAVGGWLGLLRRSVTANLGLKALSLTLALGLAFYQRGAQEEQQRTLPADVILRLPTEEVGRELMTLVPPSVNVTVRGTTRALQPLTEKGLPPIEIDLRRGERKAIDFISDQLSLPPGVYVNGIDPPRIELEWETIVERDVPLRARLEGDVSEGFHVAAVRVEPASVKARGPQTRVEVLQFVALAPFDLSDKADGIYRHRVALTTPPQRVAYLGPQSAVVDVTVAQQVLTRRFTERPVTVIGLPKAAVTPRSVDVLVKGAPDIVGALREDMIVARVVPPEGPLGRREARHGSMVGNVAVDLSGVELVIQPPTVTVRW